MSRKCRDFDPQANHDSRKDLATHLRNATPLGGILGAASISLAGHQILAVGALVVTALVAVIPRVWELWLAKRRDDSFAKIASTPTPNLAALRESGIYEAVRSRILTSKDAARLLGAEPCDSLVPPEDKPTDPVVSQARAEND
jgi:hypothetical protein